MPLHQQFFLIATRRSPRPHHGCASICDCTRGRILFPSQHQRIALSGKNGPSVLEGLGERRIGRREMKRIRIPGIVDIVSSDDAAEIEALAQDPKLDRAYADHSIPVNGKILQRVQDTLQIAGKPFPTVAPRCAEGRAPAQEALWKRLNAMAPAYSAGPNELESLAAFVRGE